MRYLLFIISLTFCSCLGMGVIDEKVLVPYTKPPSKKELVGTWEVDSFTYKMIKEKKI